MPNSKCKTSFAKPHYLKKAQSAKPCLYDIACYRDNLGNMFTPETEESIHHSEESRSKLKLLELELQPAFEYMKKNLETFKQILKEEMVEELRYLNSFEKAVESLESQLDPQRTQFSNDVDRLFKEHFYNDHMNTLLGFFTNLDGYSEMQCMYLEKCQECESLENKLSKSKTQQIEKCFANLEKHCIKLELALQHEKENNVCENT
ncbi:hypothetical protein Tco_0018437 [Tanacetum coccineum]